MKTEVDNLCDRLDNSALQSQNDSTLMISIGKLVKDTGIPKKMIYQVYTTLNNPKYCERMEWKNVPNRIVDIGVLESVYKEIKSAIQESKDIESLDKSLNEVIERYAELNSLKIYIDTKIDKCIPDLFFKLKKGEINEVGFERELTFDRVRVPHYESVILAFVLVATMVTKDKIESTIGKEQVYFNVINKLNRLKIEKKLRAKFFEHIRTVVESLDKSKSEIRLKNILVVYKEMLCALRASI